MKTKKNQTHGILLVDKPKGISSFDVIRTLRRQIQVKKMGHTGTLDPMASGLLVLCLGEGTKLVQYLTADEKGYEAVVKLGVSTNTYDAEGEIQHENEVDQLSHIDETLIRDLFSRFMGPQLQTPPLFSAIKIKGQRLYEKARKGEGAEIELPQRPITIHQLDFLEYNPLQHTLRFFVRCSKGTYIRSLAVDLAKELGVEGHLCFLRRTQCGLFHLNEASPLDQIQKEVLPDILLPLQNGLQTWPSIQITPYQEQELAHGKEISCSSLPDLLLKQKRGYALNQTGKLVALITLTEQHNIKVLRGFRY